MYLGLIGETPYSCTSTICYGVGSYDATLRQLQNAINRFVGIIPSLSAISVDGKIGSGTVSALKKIQAGLPSTPAAGALKGLLATAAISKETVTASASALVASLSQYTGTKPSAPPSVPATLPDKPTSAGPSASVPGLPPDIFSPGGGGGGKSNVKWYVLGALALGGVGFLAYRNYKEHVE